MNFKKAALWLLDMIVKVFFVIIVVMLINKYARMAYSYGYHIFNQVPVSSGTGRTVTVTIANGDSVSKIADKLANVGLITDKRLFKFQEQFSDYHGLEAPGTYELSTSMTPEEMLQIMAAGTGSALDESTDAGGAKASEAPEVAQPEASETGESNGG